MIDLISSRSAVVQPSETFVSSDEFGETDSEAGFPCFESQSGFITFTNPEFFNKGNEIEAFARGEQVTPIFRRGGIRFPFIGGNISSTVPSAFAFVLVLFVNLAFRLAPRVFKIGSWTFSLDPLLSREESWRITCSFCSKTERKFFEPCEEMKDLLVTHTNSVCKGDVLILSLSPVVRFPSFVSCLLLLLISLASSKTVLSVSILQPSLKQSFS